MKKIVLSLFALVIGFTVRAQQDVTVDFQVDMTGATLGNAGGTCGTAAFDPAVDVVQAMGGEVNNWTDWQNPACGVAFIPDDTNQLAPINVGSSIYHKVYTLLAAGGTQCQYKYRIDHSWDNDELRGTGDDGCPTSGNRCFNVPASADSAAITVFGTFNVPNETITVGITGIKSLNPPKVNSLYPNPANGKANLVYTSNQSGKVQIYLSNLVGQVVKSVFSGTQSLGVHTQAIDVNGLANGVYFLTLKVNDQSVARKFNVMN